MKRTLFPLLLATLWAGLPLASWSASPAQFEAAYQAFQDGQADNAGATDLAAERFDRLSRAEPADVVLLAYAGAAEASRARHTWLPWRKMQHAEDGLARLDRALSHLAAGDDTQRYHGTPASLEVRFTAASTFLALPEALFHRRQRGEQLLAEVQASPLFATAPLPFRGVVWSRAARHAAEQGHRDQARMLWQRIVDAGAPQAAQARTALAEGAR